MKLKDAASEPIQGTTTTLWAAPTRNGHTENLSGEMHQNTSKGEGGLGAKATARKGNVSKMIDFGEGAVQLLKPC